MFQLFYSDPNEPNPLIRVDVGFCDTFAAIREAVAAGALSLDASTEHVRTCDQCRNYLNDLSTGPEMPELPESEESNEIQ